jgi:hypothetical protein
LGNQQVFLGSFTSSQHSGGSDISSEDEEQALAEKYGFNDEEDFHETHHVEDPLEASLTFVPATHEDKEMVNFSHEDEPSSTYDSPVQRWIDQACGYTFRMDDQADGFLSSRISSLPPISMSFISSLIICLFMLMIIMCLTYLCCIT